MPSRFATANPRLIYASITGFGQDGPYADRAGYDFIIQGMGGMMSVTGLPDGEPGGGPMRAGVAIADLFTGMYTCVAIFAALHRRNTSGEGATHRHVAVRHAAGGDGQPGFECARIGRGPAAAGKHASRISCLTSRSMRPISRSSSRSATTGSSLDWRRYAAIPNGPAMSVSLQTARAWPIATRWCGWWPTSSRQKPAADWLDRLEAAGIPAGPINRLSQALSDVQAQHRGMVRAIAGIPQVGSPLRFDGERRGLRSAAACAGRAHGRGACRLGSRPGGDRALEGCCGGRLAELSRRSAVLRSATG